MGSIEENRETWSSRYGWPDGGEEWSQVWGGSHVQWQGAILPRIRNHVPTRRIVEIGCGFGRWSKRLRPLCEQLVLVDLSPRCVAACRDLFGADPGVSVVATDGLRIPGAEDAGVDFVFSFDSLVHAEQNVIESYLAELARVLAPGGAAFLHHSNFLAVLEARPGTHNLHWRAESVSADSVAAACARVGLVAARQEIVDWGTIADSDVFTTVVRAGDARAEPVLRLVNPDLMAEARGLALRERLYGTGDRDPES